MRVEHPFAHLMTYIASGVPQALADHIEEVGLKIHDRCPSPVHRHLELEMDGTHVG